MKEKLTLFLDCKAKEKIIKKRVKKGANYRDVVAALDYYPTLIRKSVGEIQVLLILRIIFGIIMGAGFLTLFFIGACESVDEQGEYMQIIVILISAYTGTFGAVIFAILSREIDRIERLIELLEKRFNH
jgi:hypothetical protein